MYCIFIIAAAVGECKHFFRDAPRTGEGSFLMLLFELYPGERGGFLLLKMV